MAEIFSEPTNFSGGNIGGHPGFGFGGGFGFSPMFGGFGGGFGGHGILETIIALKAFDRLDHDHHRGHDHDDFRSFFLFQKLADISKDGKESESEIRESIANQSHAITGEFRDLAGKLCDFRHDSVVQALQTRIDLKDVKCDIEKQIDCKIGGVKENIRDLKDGINDHFIRLREGQLLNELRDRKEEADALREKLNRGKTADEIIERLHHDRHFRDRDRDHDHDHHRRRWPTASVPARVEAPLFAFAESNPCAPGAESSIKSK